MFTRARSADNLRRVTEGDEEASGSGSQASQGVKQNDNNAMINNLAEAMKLALEMVQSQQCGSPNRTLPHFTGDINEWLVFKRAYDETSTNISKSDNINRLRLSLKGDARESVSALLFSGADPEEIIGCLQRRFGRPRDIIQNQILAVKYLPRVNENSLEEFSKFAVKINNCVITIKTLNSKGYLYNPELLSVILYKLPATIKSKWYDYAADQGEEDSDLELISKFLNREADRMAKFGAVRGAASSVQGGGMDQSGRSGAVKDGRWQSGGHRRGDQRSTQQYRAAVVTTDSAAAMENCIKCLYCCRDHVLFNCDSFKNLSVSERCAWAKNNNKCFRCLLSNHRRETCTAKLCGFNNCNGRHHWLLHYHNNMDFRGSYKTAVNTPTCSNNNNVNVNIENQNLCTNVNNSSEDVSFQSSALLKILPVTLTGDNDFQINTFALLDEGANISLIESKLCRELGLDGKENMMKVKGINTILTTPSKQVKLRIHGSNSREHYISARSFENLDLCTQSINVRELCKYAHIKQFERLISSYCNEKPRVLIGQDIWH